MIRHRRPGSKWERQRSSEKTVEEIPVEGLQNPRMTCSPRFQNSKTGNQGKCEASQATPGVSSTGENHTEGIQVKTVKKIKETTTTHKHLPLRDQQ